MLRETCALRANPFAPTAADIGAGANRKFARNLDRRPLRLDQCAALKPLFLESILGWREHQQRFRAILSGLGYDFASRSKGESDAIILVRGAQGVGKTTLASAFLALLKESFEPFRFFEFDKPDDPLNARTRDEFRKALDTIRTAVASNVQGGDQVVILIEDVTADTFPLVLGYYDELSDNPKLIFCTTHDLELMRENPNNISQNVEAFTIAPISPDDAEAFVRHRLELFRDPRIAALTTVSEVFPWSSERLRKQVKDISATQVAEASPVTLRVLSRNLSEQILAHHRRLTEIHVVPIDQAPNDKLPDYLIAE